MGNGELTIFRRKGGGTKEECGTAINARPLTDPKIIPFRNLLC